MGRKPIYDQPLSAAERQRRYRQRCKHSRYVRPTVIDGAPETGRVDDLRTMVQRGRAFGTIYADPPWPYANPHARTAGHGPHYDAMSVEQIAALPINDLAADFAHLHLWTTATFVEDALHVMKCWGFIYKSQFIWCKPTLGTGYYWRVSHEILLTGVRRPNQFFDDRLLPSWEVFRRGNHSTKPEEVRSLIERASPPPRLEMFARRVATGWCAWGAGLD